MKVWPNRTQEERFYYTFKHKIYRWIETVQHSSVAFHTKQHQKLFSFWIQGLTSKWMKKRYFCIIKSSTLYFSHASYFFVFSRVLIQVFFSFFFRGLAFTLRHCKTISLSVILLLLWVFRLSDGATSSIKISNIQLIFDPIWFFWDYLESIITRYFRIANRNRQGFSIENPKKEQK